MIVLRYFFSLPEVAINGIFFPLPDVVKSYQLFGKGNRHVIYFQKKTKKAGNIKTCMSFIVYRKSSSAVS
jgi:N-glycosylase/DNA lyase